MGNKNVYERRDTAALDKQGGFYSRHINAMTTEGLVAKADIAAELAHRDAVIAKLQRNYCGPLPPSTEEALLHLMPDSWVALIATARCLQEKYQVNDAEVPTKDNLCKEDYVSLLSCALNITRYSNRVGEAQRTVEDSKILATIIAATKEQTPLSTHRCAAKFVALPELPLREPEKTKPEDASYGPYKLTDSDYRAFYKRAYVDLEFTNLENHVLNEEQLAKELLAATGTTEHPYAARILNVATSNYRSPRSLPERLGLFFDIMREITEQHD